MCRRLFALACSCRNFLSTLFFLVLLMRPFAVDLGGGRSGKREEAPDKIEGEKLNSDRRN